jgi:outer membrane protein OmpA-like peptidoglycan-associated protein
MKRFLALAIFAALAAASPARAQPEGGMQPLFVVFFPDWSGAIDDAASSVIARAAVVAKIVPKATIQVTGYADNAGSAQANIYLTQLRAQRVIDGLVADGVPAAQLQLIAKGAQAIPGVSSRRVEIAFPMSAPPPRP